MLKHYAERLKDIIPMPGLIGAVAASAVQTTLQLNRLVFVTLRAVTKCWSVLKDIHFSWYVIIPVLSSISPLGEASALVLTGLLLLPILVVIAFSAMESVFNSSGPDANAQSRPLHGWQAEPQPFAGLTGSGTPAYRQRAIGFTPMQSRMLQQSRRRHLTAGQMPLAGQASGMTRRE